MGKPTHLLEPWQKEDAARLLALFEKYRANGGQKQEDFAADYGIGSQGNMGHYLHGRRPLNIETAGKFAKGLGISVEAFSPTLAGKIAAAHQTTNAAKRDVWPLAPERQSVEPLHHSSMPASCGLFFARDGRGENIFALIAAKLLTQ